MPSSRLRLVLMSLLALVATLGAGPATAAITRDLKVRWLGERPQPAVAGREFVGQLEVIAARTGRLEHFEIAGAGWTVVTSGAPVQALMTPGDRRVVTFRATPDDPARPLVIRARFDGDEVEKALRLDAASLEKRKLHYADPSGPKLSGKRVTTPGAAQDQQIAFMGDFRYKRGDNVVVGGDHLTVKVWDDDSPDPFDEVIWSGFTDANGHFEGAVSWDDCDISGCDAPDVYVEVIATSPAVDVQTSDVLEETYSWQTSPIDDFGGTFINFGTIEPGIDVDENAAVHIFNSVTRAHRFASERAGMNAPLVDVQWPDFGDNSRYNRFFEEIHITPAAMWNEITHVHEFGHHLHYNFGNLLEPDYENGYCDPGHCYWCPEQVGEGWQEGVAYWYAMVVVEAYPSDYGQTAWVASNPDGIYGQESVGTCHVDNTAHPDGRTEGYVAALLRDMWDGNNDDHDGGAVDCDIDAMSIGYDEILTVFRDDDPTDIGMFLAAFRARYPQHDMDLWSTTRNVGPTFGFPLPAPAVTTAPRPCTMAREGDVVVLAVAGNGSRLKYRWRLNGLLLEDDPWVSGVHTKTLTLTDVQDWMAGVWDCVVSTCDSTQSVTSAGARLTVFAAPAQARPHLTYGENYGAQCGNGTNVVELPPGSYTGLQHVVQAEGGRSFSIALRADGKVFTWGRTESGEIGNGGYWGNYVHSPYQVGLSNVIHVAAGNHFAFALLRDGTVLGWGGNFYGQLGDSTRNDRLVPSATRFPGCIVALAAGYSHTLALDADGHVWAVGYGATGQMGNGTNTIINTVPLQVPGLSDVVAIRAAGYTSYALKADGTVWSWGYNAFGNLGNGTTADAWSPVQVSGLANIRAIAAAYYNGYAIANTGEVHAWGRGDMGTIGNGSGAWRLTPVVIPGITNPRALESGDAGWTAAVLQDGSMRAWGYNANTVLGTGAPNGTYRYTPEPVLGVTGANGLGAGYATAHVFGHLNGVTGVDPPTRGDAPLALALRVSPVPSRAITSLAFDLPTSGVVSIAVYDVAGKRVHTIAHAWRPAGRHVATWDGRFGDGAEAPAGVYFARLERGGEVRTHRMVLVR